MHLTHVVARVPTRGSRHVTAVGRVVLLVSRRVVMLHHVAIGHVSVRHLVHVTSYHLLDSGGSSCGPRRVRPRQQRAGAKRVLVFLEQRLRLAARPVLVIGVLLHVHCPQPLGLVDKGPLLRLTQKLPLGPQPFRDLRVMHLRVLLSHLASLTARPHHEGVHRPLDAVNILVLTVAVVVV